MMSQELFSRIPYKSYEIATSGCVETVKIGRCLRINAGSLDRWLEFQRYPRA